MDFNAILVGTSCLLLADAIKRIPTIIRTIMAKLKKKTETATPAKPVEPDTAGNESPDGSEPTPEADTPENPAKTGVESENPENSPVDWRLRMAIADGELPPPPNGMEVDDELDDVGSLGALIPGCAIGQDR